MGWARSHWKRAAVTALWLTGATLAAACGLPAKSSPVEAVDGGEVTARAGGTFSLSLSDNPSTGYQWQATVGDPTVVFPDGSPESGQPEARGEGADGKVVFRFRALAAGSTVIVLSLARPWEEQAIETRRVQVTVEADR